MKVVTNYYKNNVKTFGRELDSLITYTINGVETELGGEELNSVTPHYKADILKSVMKQLDIDSNVDIPLNTVINYQFGVKVGNSYEYVDYGNYVVIKSEKKEDTDSYLLTCYDKMIYAMKDYEDMNLVYPMTVRDYISEICNYLRLTFKNYNSTFANYNKTINTELYLDSQGNSLGYTFRDVLDQLAEVTGSVICINELDDELEIRYPNSTGVTLNEEYLKDVNVKFGKVYGPVNTIVLSRSADSDKIYDSYPSDLPDEDKIAVEIKDNQIMNFNDRDTYLPDILNRLLGLTYSIADYSSTGITFLELYDMYNVSIGETTYPCLMLEDEAQITQGLSENVVAEEPQTSETDYTKADKTDRRINQTYLIVDKQNQTIESVVSTVGEQNTKISQITQTVDEINSKISDIADITTSNETTMASMTMNDINASEPIQLKVYPIGQNISYLYPRSNLYPSSTLYPTIRTIRFHNNTTSENFDYILPDDLLYYDSNNYDEFLLDYGDGTSQTQICQVTKKCKYNADGTVGLLTTPVTSAYTYPSILLTDGDYTVSILSYSQGYIFARLMAKNIYTTQFYTKAETNSIIDQTASEIELGVSQTLSNYSTTAQMNSAINVKANEINSVVATKVGNNEVISKINQTSEQITINANKVNLTGYVTATDLSGSGTTTINGANITTGNIQSSNYQSGTSGTKINLSDGSIDTKGFKVSSTGDITSTGGTIGGWNINSNQLQKTVGNYSLEIKSDSNASSAKFLVYDLQNDRFNWYVTGEGKMYARNAEISGTVNATSGSFTGSIYSSSGTIGGWSLNSQGLYGSSNGKTVSITPAYLTASNGYEVEDRTWWSIVTNSPSDKKVKHDIKDVTNQYENFYNELKPVSFKYNDDFEERKKESTHFGFIAQDIEKSIKDNNLDDLAMIYGNKLLKLDKEEIIALNTWQIQKLKEEIKELKKEMEELKNAKN